MKDTNGALPVHGPNITTVKGSGPGLRRQPQFEAAATAGLGLHADPSPMGLDDGFDQAQPEPQPPARTALVAAVETGPDVRQLVRWNTDSRVGHRQRSVAGLLPRGYFDAAAAGRVLQGIVEQVRQRLAHAIAVH